MSQLLRSGRPLPYRKRNELVFRQIIVTSRERVGDKFWRISFTGSDLKGFSSPGTDDHIKLFFFHDKNPELPKLVDGVIEWPAGKKPESRDYTPLNFTESDKLVIDFYRHQGGIASEWAETAAIGDQLIIGGPRGSLVVPVDYQNQLYILDETGLPALKRRLAEISGQKHRVIIFTDQQTAETYLGPCAKNIELIVLGTGEMNTESVHRAITAAEDFSLPEDDYYLWLTGEGAAVKYLNDYFLKRRGANPDLVRAVAYWHKKQV